MAQLSPRAAPGWGTAQPAPSAEPCTQQAPPRHSPTEGRAAAPARATRWVCFTRQRWGSDTRRHSPSLSSRRDEGSHPWQTPQWHCRNWDLHFDPIRSQLIYTHTNCHNYYIIETSTKHTDCPLLTSSTVGFTACRHLWYKLLLFVIHSLEIQQSATIIPNYNV